MTDAFQIQRQLGRGSYGVVYKVKRKSDGLEYAMKAINLHALSHRER